MNLFGVGFLELAVIFLVTFLVMGPARSIEMARTAGKLVGDLRRTLGEMTAAADLSGANRSAPTTPPAPTDPANAAKPANPSQPPAEPAPPPPAQAIPITGPGEGNEQQS